MTEYREITDLDDNIIVRVPKFESVEDFKAWELKWHGHNDDETNVCPPNEQMDLMLAECYWKTWRRIATDLAHGDDRIVTITLDVKS